MTKPVTKYQRTVMARCRQNPEKFTPRQAMRTLKLPYHYSSFTRLMWRCTKADALEGQIV
jgi:hypothetical protein